MSIYIILVPLALISLPFILLYFWCSLGLFFTAIEWIGKNGKAVIEKSIIRIEHFIDYNPGVREKYFKIFAIASYIIIGIMILCKIFGVEFK